MNFFKRLSILTSLIIFTSCTGLNSNKQSLKDIRDILGIDNTENKSEEEKILITQDEFLQEDVVLTNENVSKYLEDVKTKLRNTEKRIENTVSDNYKVFVGEFLVAPLAEGNRAKITSSPRNTNSRLNVENNNFIFRTIYKGNYNVSIYQGNNLLRRVNISALTKYNFTENNIYDIIAENLDKKNKVFEDAVSLYKIYYPNGKYIRKVNYWLLEYAYENNNKTILKESVEALKNDLDAFNDEEKEKIVKAANLINKQIFIPANVYNNTSNTSLSKEVASYIKNKNILDKKDVEFLEKVSVDENSDEKKLSLEKISNWYSNNGEINKAKEITNQNSVTKAESLFDTAVKNMKSNPKLAIDNFKKSLASERNSDKRAETYYNLASSYVNLGNKVEALKYLTLLKQESGTSAWAKKAELLLNTLK